MQKKFYWLLLLFLGLPNLAVATREICGDPPPEQFREENNESIKGDLEGKANFLSSFVGKAELGGKIEATRKEIFAKYSDANAAYMDRYLAYMFCWLLFDPKNTQAPQDKIKAIQEFKRQQQSAIPPGEPKWCNPVISTAGPVTIICQGVTSKALEVLNADLRRTNQRLEEKIEEANIWAHKYDEILRHLKDLNRGPAQKGKELVEEGKLEEANQILFTEYYNMAHQNRKDKNYTQAIANYIQALLISPDHFGAYYNLADSYRKIGKNKQALPAFEKALELSPNNARVHYNMANLYQEKGEDNKAKEYYKKVIALEPEASELSQRAKENLKVLGK